MIYIGLTPECVQETSQATPVADSEIPLFRGLEQADTSKQHWLESARRKIAYAFSTTGRKEAVQKGSQTSC